MSQPASILESLYQEEVYRIPSRVLIILSGPWEDLREEDRTVLTKMLAAVKLSLASVQIIAKKEFAISELGSFAPSKILAFGARLQQASPLYEKLVVDGVPVILAEDLRSLDDAKKKSLWGALRVMFGI